MKNVFRNNQTEKNKKLFLLALLGFMKHSKDKVPEKPFMEGVSEQSIVGISAGLALEGYQPFVNTIATFLLEGLLNK